MKFGRSISARCQVAVFLLLTFLITGIFHWRFIFHGGLENNKFLTIPLMWTPGIIGLFCSLIFGHKLKDIGFKKVSFKQLGISYLIPAGAAIIILCLLLLFGIDSLGISSKFIEKFGNQRNVFLMMLLVAPTVGVINASLRALGEEIGWRGFLHARFIELKLPHPYLIIGIIWAIWHLPLILFADYATSELPYFSAFLFSLMIISVSVFMGWQREFTGAVWPAVITHGVHNTWIQGVYPAFISKGPKDQYFGGESGVFLCIIYLSVAIFIYRKKLS